MSDYANIALESRKKVLELIFKAQTSHIGSNFSCADIMAVLFEKMNLDRDVFVLSAGWKAAMLYYHLWRKGRITKEQLDSYCLLVKCFQCDGTGIVPLLWKILNKRCFVCGGVGKTMSSFIGLAEPNIQDIPIAGGSMGLGFPGAVGIALAKKLRGDNGLVYVLMSDGELQAGTTWEAALIALQHTLNNLVVLVDWNGLQAMGRVDDILKIPTKYGGGFSSWDVSSISGHNYEEIAGRIELKRIGTVPRLIICRTVKGKGVSRFHNDNLYHYKQLDYNEYTEAIAELNDPDLYKKNLQILQKDI